MHAIEASTAEGAVPYDQALAMTTEWLVEAQASGRKIMIFGNGGSAGVASHLGVDFWKNGGVRCMTFNDASVLTCISNDYSYADVFAVPVAQFADPGDLVIAISSSGGSENILKGAQAGIDHGCKVITCSGFANDNPLRKLGDANFYVPSYSYGFVETLHQLIIHSILDIKLQLVDHKNVFHRNQPMDF